MKLIGMPRLCTYQLAPGLILSSCSLVVELSSCISNYHHIPTRLQKTVKTHSLNFFICAHLTHLCHLHNSNNNNNHYSHGCIHCTSVFALIYVSFAYLCINYHKYIKNRQSITDLFQRALCFNNYFHSTFTDSFLSLPSMSSLPAPSSSLIILH